MTWQNPVLVWISHSFQSTKILRCYFLSQWCLLFVCVAPVSQVEVVRSCWCLVRVFWLLELPAPWPSARYYGRSTLTCPANSTRWDFNHPASVPHQNTYTMVYAEYLHVQGLKSIGQLIGKQFYGQVSVPSLLQDKWRRCWILVDDWLEITVWNTRRHLVHSKKKEWTGELNNIRDLEDN